MSLTENSVNLASREANSQLELLPEFVRPPVTEVALSLQFHPIDKLRGTLIGLLWGKFKDRYPVIEEHPPIEPVIEQFGELQSVGKVQFQFLEAPLPTRVWFVNKSGNELIQVQQDRFVYNWRKVNDDDLYPRYSDLRSKLVNELELFRQFLNEEQLGALVFNQTEVTFVNTIVSGNGWERHGELHKVLTIHSGAYSDSFLDEPENLQTALRYVIPNETGKPRGRLHITVFPVVSIKDKKLAFNLTLTARCTPDGSIDDAKRCLDLSHRWMVKAFASITTKEMHRIWERNR